MPDDPAITKRIRRRIIASYWEFFAITSPGLEKVCHDECCNCSFSSNPPKIVNGGVECSGRVHQIYQANLYLRTANRIVMRIGGFNVSNFRQLEKKLSRFSWELFFDSGISPQVKVSLAHSRLYHSKAVKDRVSEILQNALQSTSPAINSPEITQTLYVRIVNDFATLSLDSSGDILYKRGVKIHGGHAPLRETVACAALMIAGYDCKKPLIDPMCGSGTFSMEAAMMARNIPAGWFRKFAFEYWPCFSKKRWNFIRKQAENDFIPVNKPIIFASDIDSCVCNDLKNSVKKIGFDNLIQINGGLDFFTLYPNKLIESKGMVVLNPPYGLRMDPLAGSTEKLFDEIFKKLKNDYKQWKVAMIVPNRHIVKVASLSLRTFPLFHGGLKLFLLYGMIPG